MPRAQCLVTRGFAILMVRHESASASHWCLPGGGVLPGESPEAAALRELVEECGLRGIVIRPTAVTFGAHFGAEHTFLVEVGDQEPRLGHDPELEPDRQILAAVRWLDFRDLPERDRAHLWAAGLLSVSPFGDLARSWPNYPR